MVVDVKPICRELELDASRCERLENLVQRICGGKAPKPRKKSLWQQCIAKERKGKPFDPKAIKELAKLYRAGKCP